MACEVNGVEPLTIKNVYSFNLIVKLKSVSQDLIGVLGKIMNKAKERSGDSY